MKRHHFPAAARYWQEVTGEPYQPSDARDVAHEPLPPCEKPCGWCSVEVPCEAMRAAMERRGA